MSILYTAIATSCGRSADPNSTVPKKVELKKESYGFQIYVNGEPYYMKGAGTDGHDPASVAKYGGNTMRTWSTGNEHFSGKELLDGAHANGLMVVMGLNIARERHGFDYDDEAAVKKQLEFVREEVMKYKDHPALLAWGIGNELNLRYTNKKVWNAVNEISEMIKKVDPNHLTTTMIAGASPEVIQAVSERGKSLDFLSFQLYGSINKLPGYIAESAYEGAYAMTEWGVTGHWEVPLTAWHRPIEENSHIKAMAYKERYEKFIAADTYHCIGSFVFLWGQKQERTPTWYGMFLKSGEKTESVDVMQYLWTGAWPENRAPQLQHFLINGLTAYDDVYLSPDGQLEAEVLATDPDGDKLNYFWEILPEVPVDQQSDGGDFEPRPTTLLGMDSTDYRIFINAPEAPGEYRLFVYVFDGNNNAATANIPFYVN
ncbi:MAG: DUF4434 domain-containing protein [Bacteroidales bacterium]|nr:DUF4434 domain-containing protein [Bacteroidales bacterium]